MNQWNGSEKLHIAQRCILYNRSGKNEHGSYLLHTLLLFTNLRKSRNSKIFFQYQKDARLSPTSFLAVLSSEYELMYIILRIITSILYCIFKRERNCFFMQVIVIVIVGA